MRAFERRNLLLLLLVVFLGATANAQLTYNPGDLFLGFHATSGVGALQCYLVKIGPASDYQGSPGTVVTPSLGNLGADLQSVFGPSWSTRSDVLWGIFGAPLAGDPNNTLYASKAEDPFGTLAPPWLSRSGSNQAATATRMNAVSNAYITYTPTANSPVAAIQNLNDSNSYGSSQPPLSSGSFNGGFQPTIEGNFANTAAQSALDMFRIVPAFPAQPGVYRGTFTISAGGQLTFTVLSPPPPPTITSPGTASGVQGLPFTYQITATGNPTSFGATGLPAGLAVNSATGAISGTPTEVGNSQVTLSATNSVGTGTATLSLTIAAPPAPTITSPGTASGVQGQPFTYQITASGNPTSFDATGLPAGLGVNSTTGLISGTPTEVGSFRVTLSATNSGGTGTASLSLTITATLLPPVITSSPTAAGVQGQSFSYQITATSDPTSFGATGLPAGLSVNTTTGLISGTPTVAGNFQVTLSATNAAGTGTGSLSLTISAAPPPIITSPATASGVQGQPFTYQITASGNPTSFDATGLPTGLMVNTSTGLISGTPTVLGTFQVTLSATNNFATGTSTLALSITAAPPPIVTSPATASGVQGQPFTYQITASGNPTSFNAAGLPSGLTVNTSTGLVSGTPTQSGSFQVTLSATNAFATGTSTLALTVSPAPSPTPGAQLANISSRVAVGTGDKVAIAGYIINGSGPKRVIVRAIGPSTGVPGALLDPRLSLYDESGNLIVANDNWKDVQEAEINATGIAPADDREAAIVRSLDPGAYTAVMSGAGSTTGVGLVEVFDLAPAAAAKLANISTRGQVGNGPNVLIGGVIITGSGSARVLIRGLGPSTGLPDALSNPILSLYDGNGQLIYANDNWQDSQEAEIRATNLQPLDPREAAIIRTLGPGVCTAILAGAGGSTGIGMVEVYRVSP